MSAPAGKSQAKQQARERAEKLEAQGSIREAAEIWASLGEHLQASALLERACDFGGAAKQSLLGRDIRRAIELFALAGDTAACDRAMDELVRLEPRDVVVRTAGVFSARGLMRPAACLFQAAGEYPEAAKAFASAGDARQAAHCFEQAGQPAEGARTLEAALRRDPDDSAARLALGQLLSRHGRTEGAVRTLQKLPENSDEYRTALPLLARGLSELQLNDAAAQLRDRMKILGISESPAGANAHPSAYAPSDEQKNAVLFYGRYAMEREIASTPHARVILAKDRIQGSPVVLKIYAASSHEAGRDAALRFEREARALSQMRHPNVVPLLAYVPEGPAMVLAYMAGGSLADRMRVPQSITPKRASEIAATLLSALGEAHRLGILHRDIKPSNVLFDDVGTPYLSDFGAAHLGDLSATATAAAIGTFAYMSPEQKLGQPASIQSDIYGVGAVLYELLTGLAPAPLSDGASIPLPSGRNPDLGPAHDAIVRALLSEGAAGRPPDAFEARRILLSCAWPDRLPKAQNKANEGHVPSVPAASPSAPEDERLGPSRDEGADTRDGAVRRFDTWTGRDVLVLPLDAGRLALGQAFARAAHPALATVLRADPAASELWISAPRGRALSDAPRAIPPGALARLREAVAALHQAQGAHGHIDLEHLYMYEGELCLAFPRGPAGEDAAQRDLEALEKLAMD